MVLDEKAERRFNKSFHKNEETGCWDWTGTSNNAGYPLFSYKGRMVSASKTAYKLNYEEDIPGGHVVSHTCDNVKCVNPDHIYVTSRSDLVKDLYKSGKMKAPEQKGADNPNAKLSEEDVREIRRKKEEGITHEELAKEYGVTKTTISQIYNRKLWSHID